MPNITPVDPGRPGPAATIVNAVKANVGRAGASQCDYCASAHTFVAQGAGVDKAEAALNLRGSATDPKTDAILKFARAVVSSRGRLPESARTLNELGNAGVSDGEIVEVLAHIGLNLFTNYFNHVVKTEIDFPLVTAEARSQ